MYRLITQLLIVGLLAGCGPRKLSPGEVATEKKAIETLLSDFWKAYESKDISAASKFYSRSSDLMVFGSDSAEVMTSLTQWETQIKNDWELFQTVKIGEMRNIGVLVSDDGMLGSIVCEFPADMIVGGQSNHFLFRLAGAVRKENGQWHFVQGMMAVPTVGQSSAELVAKMKAEAAMPAKQKPKK
jgi:ketosteroid isomerase-like protein